MRGCVYATGWYLAPWPSLHTRKANPVAYWRRSRAMTPSLGRPDRAASRRAKSSTPGTTLYLYDPQRSTGRADRIDVFLTLGSPSYS